MPATRRRRRTGGGAALPLTISGLQLWLDANDGSTLFQDSAKTTPAGSGDVVGAWVDKSGNGLDATRTVTASKPTVQANIQNGHSVLRFDGADDLMLATFGTFNAPVSIFAVVYFANVNQPAGDFDYVMSIGDGTISPGAAKIISVARQAAGGNADKYYLYDGDATYIGQVLTGQTWMILSVQHDTSATFHNMWLNGASQVVADYAVAITTDGDVQIGTVAGGNYINGDYGEVIIYDRFLSISERQQVEDYLSNKWGVALS